MTNTEQVSHYCFNNVCHYSVFNISSVKVIRMALSIAVNSNQKCDNCGSELISLLDIELKRVSLGISY